MKEEIRQIKKDIGPNPPPGLNQGVEAGPDIQAGKSNPRLVEAVSVIRNGQRELLTEVNDGRILAGRDCLASRLSPEEVAKPEDFKFCLQMNPDKSAAYYTMAMINHPENRDYVVSISTGSLTPSGTLIIGYAATRVQYAGGGIGRSVVNDLMDNAERESKDRGWGGVKLVALEASGDSPGFWKKIGCRAISLVQEDGTTVPFKYIQPTFAWDYNTGMPVGECLSSSVKINLNGQKLKFPGVNEKLMVKTLNERPVTTQAILSAVTDFLDNYYFTAERESFANQKAYETYLACRTGLIEAYSNQLNKAKVIRLTD